MQDNTRHLKCGTVSEDDGSDVRQLERQRHDNDEKLKARFEHIFSKYEHDFTGVGDEIDMFSGDIVVNNGHLQYMRHEVDPGKSAIARFVRTFQQKLEREGDSMSDDECDIEEEKANEDYSDSFEDEDESDEEDGASILDSSSVEVSCTSSPIAPGLHTSVNALGNLKRPAPRLARLLIGEGTPQRPIDLTGELQIEDDTSSHASVLEHVTPSNMSEHASDLQKLIPSFRTSAEHSILDQDAINKLGESIANKLAHLMAGSPKKQSNEKRASQALKTSSRNKRRNADLAWNYPDLTPHHSPRQKRHRCLSSVAAPPAFLSPPQSPGEESLWAPKGSARPSKRRRTSETPVQHQDTPGSSRVDRSVFLSSGGRSNLSDKRRCWNCSLTNTSSWKKGPHDQDLCSSCGKYFQIHRRMKPFDSPTPSVEGDGEGDQIDLAAPQTTYIAPLTDARNRETGQSVVAEGKDTQHIHHEDYSEQRDESREIKLEPSITTATRIMPIAAYLANTSRPLATTSRELQETTPWTAHDDALIIRLKEHVRLPWPAVARHFPERSLCSIQERYSKVLHQGQSDGRKLLQKHPDQIRGMVTHEKTRHLADDHVWSSEQDKLVLELRDARELTWEEISSFLPGHSMEAVAQRYRILADFKLKRSKQNVPKADSPHSSHSSGFTASDDALIVRLKEVQLLSWKQIAQHFPMRTWMALQKRYSSKLAPHKRKLLSTSTSDPAKGTVEDSVLAVDPELGGQASSAGFTSREDASTKELRELQNLDRDTIALRMAGHTAKALEHRYQYMCSQTSLSTAVAAQSGVVKVECSRLGGSTKKPAGKVTLTPDLNVPLRNKTSPAATFYPEPAATLDSPKFQQFDVPARPGPGSRTPFTEEEDDWIRKSREANRESWNDITMSLPGRSTRSIITRHQEIITSSEESPSGRGLEPASSSTQASPSGPHSRALRPRRSLQAILPSVRRNANPLLRRALGNSLRRRSDQAQKVTPRLAPESTGDDDDDETVPARTSPSNVIQDQEHMLKTSLPVPVSKLKQRSRSWSSENNSLGDTKMSTNTSSNAELPSHSRQRNPAAARITSMRSKRFQSTSSTIKIPNSVSDNARLLPVMDEDELSQASPPPLPKNRPSSYRTNNPRLSPCEVDDAPIYSNETPVHQATMLQPSSSPLSAKPRRSFNTPDKFRTPRTQTSSTPQLGLRAYSRSTSTPNAIFISRSTPGPSLRDLRIAGTPVREVDSDDDDLA